MDVSRSALRKKKKESETTRITVFTIGPPTAVAVRKRG